MDAKQNGQTEPTNQTFSIIRVGDLLKEKLGTEKYIVDNLLTVGGTSLLVAKPKVGKGTLARTLARAVVRGIPFLSLKTERGPVLYLRLERNRLRAQMEYKKLGIRKDEDLYAHIGGAPEKPLADLRNQIIRLKLKLVIVDPITWLLRITDASDYAEITAKLEQVVALADETGCHILMIYHLGKTDRDGGDQILGSTAWYAAVDTVMIMRRRDKFRVLETRQRYGSDMEPAAIGLAPETGEVKLLGRVQEVEKTQAAESIVEFLKLREGPVDEATIRESVSGSNTMLAFGLRDGFQRGLFTRTGSGKRGDAFFYTLSSNGKPTASV